MPDRSAPPPARKDRLIQTRVPRELETTLKAEARRRRLTVSHLIRSVLEDTFQLVDGVVADVDDLVTGSVRLARNARRNARRLVSPGRERPLTRRSHTRRGAAGGAFPNVYAWSQLVLNRPGACSACGAHLARGERGFFGLSDDTDAPRAWLCERCVEAL
jgi:hypothetical protein